ncbi:MAG: hypothetical protein AB9836_04595 [Aminipila sp.]
MENNCTDCEYISTCELANQISFCDDCEHGCDCAIRSVCCDKGYDIECNNGFEEKGYC